MKTLSNYEQSAIDFLTKTNATLSIEYSRYGKHFDNDKDERDIYKCVLQRGSRKYEFDFGQSVVHSGKFIVGYKFKFNSMPSYSDMPKGYQRSEVKINTDFSVPTIYDILACLQKYDVGTFDDFVSEFGYEFNTVAEFRRIEKTYNAVVTEVTAVKMLFTDAEIEVLQEIN